MGIFNYTMRKITLLLLFILPALFSQAFAENNLTVSSAEVAPGSAVTVDLLIDNNDEFVAFQVDIPIPEQLSFVSNTASLNPDRITDHMLQANIIDGNILRIFGFSFSNSAFVGNSGPVVSFEIIAGSQHGVFELEPTNALISSFGGDNIMTNGFPGTITVLSIDDVLVLNEHIIEDGDEVCFDSSASIVTGGNGGWFQVQQGGNATLIAGHSITLLPGTSVENGGYLLARIAIDDEDHCQIPEATKITSDSSGGRDHLITTGLRHEANEMDFFRIFPNPADGVLNLEIASFQNNQSITVEFHSAIGGYLFSKNLPLQRLHTLSLDRLQPGMYIVRVINGDQTGTQRLIKR